MERTDEIEAGIASRHGSTSSWTANFMLRPGEVREFLGKALQACTGHAANIMLKAISNTLPTRQILHKWFPKEHTKATCELCGNADESIAHFTLNCENFADATTAAHDIQVARRRLSKALEKTLTKSPYRWVFHWEKQAGLAFPGLVGTQGSHNWDELKEVWINLSIPSCDLDKLRPDSIHFCYDQSDITQHIPRGLVSAVKPLVP